MAFTFKHGDRPLEGYTIQRGIGRGGFGEVYYAVSDGGREVALKYLRDNAEIELRGVSHCMNLKSPHLVTIFDVVKSPDGEFFIIMEHVSGPSLRDVLIAEPTGVGVEKAAFFMREIGKGLGYLHDRGIVHRDMKPANIFYEEGHVKIGDYGLSKFISVSRHSAQTTSVGTVHYMAPEVGSGNYHRGIDIYALGVILYEMLLGKVPFEGSSMGEILMKHLTERPEIEGLPEPFGKVIRKALEKDPKDRYQTVHEMVDDILDVGAVRQSLAGFNPTTITAVPRQPAGGVASPVPSPNPQRPRPAAPAGVPSGLDVGWPGPLPRTLEKRLRRISERVDRKMDKLAGRPYRPRPRPEAAPPPNAPGIAQAPTASAETTVQRNLGRSVKRFFVSTVLTAAVSVGIAMLIGSATGKGEIAASAGLMIAGMTLGLTAAPRVIRRLGEGAEPEWVQKLILIGCCGPLMLIASIPIATYRGEAGIAFLVAMLVTLVVANWEERWRSGASGELSFWNAITLGVFGGIAMEVSAAIADFHSDAKLLLVGGAICGSLSLLTQALSWFLRPAAASSSGHAVPGRTDTGPKQTGTPPPPSPPHDGAPEARYDVAGAAVPFALPVGSGTPVSSVASAGPPRKARSVFTRACYSVFAFIMLFGIVANIIFAALVGDEVLAHVIASVACFSLMLFALQKLTLWKRYGFWRETLLPFLIAGFMTALGSSIAAIATGAADGGEDLAAAVIGIVFSGIMLLCLFVMRVWPHRPPVKYNPAMGSGDGGGVSAFVINCCDDPNDPACGSDGGDEQLGVRPGEAKA